MVVNGLINRKSFMKKICFLFFIFVTGCSGERPKDLGTPRTSLSPCSENPNCVSSKSIDKEHRVAPLKSTIPDIRRVLLNMDRVTIITQNENYLYAEFTSAMMRFVDDVEFLYDPGQQVVQIRSASRLGKSDLGVNRKRIEFIRSALKQ